MAGRLIQTDLERLNWAEFLARLDSRAMYRSVARMNDALLEPVETGHEKYRLELLEQARVRAVREARRWTSHS